MQRVKLWITTAVALGLAAEAFAGPQQGVRCPSGFQALITDNNRKLVCRRTVNFERDAKCPPGFKLDERGSQPDQCVPSTDLPDPVKKMTVLPSFAEPMVNMPWHEVVSDLKQVTRPGQPDVFRGTAHEYKFPELGPIYVGDAKNGVSCPAGYDGDLKFVGRGIRCDKKDGPAKSADCDGIVGWEFRMDLAGDEDRCRNVITGETGPTKPAGMTKVQHDLDRARDDAGWSLTKKKGERDTWQRWIYAFPLQ